MFAPVTVSSRRYSATVTATERLVLGSVRRDGVELLAPEGAPLMTPWFGRLPATDYVWSGRSVTMGAEDPRVHLDGGRPLHGLTGSPEQWRLVTRSAAAVAILSGDLSGPAFPFPFRHEVRVSAEADGITVTTRLEPLGPTSVPVAFGWHPYLRLAEPRENLEGTVVSGTLGRRLILSGGLPTGAVGTAPGRHLDQFLDDAWTARPGDQVTVAGAAGPVSVVWGQGYGWAVTWGPPGVAFVCAEPLSGPLNPLSPGSEVISVPPGAWHVAEFRIC
jgi:aldose 1-epimerase